MSSFRTRFRAVSLTAFAFLACIAGAAIASQVSLSSTRIHLAADHPVETVVVTNQEARDVSFEVQVSRWTQKSDGQWEMAPTEGLVVFPLIVRIPKSGNARVRIGSLAPTVAAEEAYRIELKELPDRTPAASGQIRMLTNLNVPVFVQPPNAKPTLAMTAEGIGASGADFLLRNTGTGYAAPSPATLRVLDADGRTINETQVTTNYVLAGSQLRVHADVPASACARAASLALVVGDDKPLVAPVAPGMRRCAN